MDREKVEKHMANLTADRRNRMAQILIREGSIKVGEMAERFGSTEQKWKKLYPQVFVRELFRFEHLQPFVLSLKACAYR